MRPTPFKSTRRAAAVAALILISGAAAATGLVAAPNVFAVNLPCPPPAPPSAGQPSDC
jgi:hypothetical protein